MPIKANAYLEKTARHNNVLGTLDWEIYVPSTGVPVWGNLPMLSPPFLTALSALTKTYFASRPRPNFFRNRGTQNRAQKMDPSAVDIL